MAMAFDLIFLDHASSAARDAASRISPVLFDAVAINHVTLCSLIFPGGRGRRSCNRCGNRDQSPKRFCCRVVMRSRSSRRLSANTRIASSSARFLVSMRNSGLHDRRTEQPLVAVLHREPDLLRRRTFAGDKQRFEQEQRIRFRCCDAQRIRKPSFFPAPDRQQPVARNFADRFVPVEIIFELRSRLQPFVRQHFPFHHANGLNKVRAAWRARPRHRSRVLAMMSRAPASAAAMSVTPFSVLMYFAASICGSALDCC